MISRYNIENLECKRNIESEKIEKYRLNYGFDFRDRKLNKKEKTLEVGFSFLLSYMEDIGNIKVDGKIFFSDTLKRLKEIDETWDTDKEPQKMAINSLFVNIVALIFDLTRHMGLPAPIKLPFFKDEIS